MERLANSLMQRKVKGQEFDSNVATISSKKIRIATQPTLFTLKKTQQARANSSCQMIPPVSMMKP